MSPTSKAKAKAGKRERGRATRRILEFIDQHPATIVASSAADLAARLGTSDATIIRAIQSRGYDGLPHLKAAIAARLDAGASLAHERVSGTIKMLRQAANASPLRAIHHAYGDALTALKRAEIDAAFDAAIGHLAAAQRIALYGLGPLAELVRQTRTHLKRVGRDALVLEGGGRGFADALLELRAGDALIVLGYGRVQIESRQALRAIRALNGKSVVITDNPGGALAALADCVLVVPRFEAGNMMLYGTILMALEAIVLALTLAEPARALAAARRLEGFRAALTPTSKT